VQHLDAARIVEDEPIGDRAGAVRRAVVDDEKTEPWMLEHAGRQKRQVLAFVIRWRND
jgi:hypothetical protein